MRSVVTGLEAVAFLVPDPLVLGFIAPALFGLCHCAVALGIQKPGDTGADLPICLVFGYLVSVALNLPDATRLPVGPNPASVFPASKGAGVRHAEISEQRRLT